MSNGKEFQRTDAATGNERRPTVDRRNGGTWRPSDFDDDESSSECHSVQSLRCSFSSTVLSDIQ